MFAISTPQPFMLIRQAVKGADVTFHADKQAAIREIARHLGCPVSGPGELYEREQGGYRLRHIISSIDEAAFLLGEPASSIQAEQPLPLAS